MAKQKVMNVTQQDRSELVSAYFSENKSGRISPWHFTYSRRNRMLALELVTEDFPADKFPNWRGYVITELGLATIQAMIVARELRDAEIERKRAEHEAEEVIRWEKQEQQEEAFKAELRGIGVTLFTLARASENWTFAKRAYGMEYRVEFPITCHVEYNRHDNRYFVRAAVGHSGECDTAALIAEAKQAQVACDYLNAKLKGE